MGMSKFSDRFKADAVQLVKESNKKISELAKTVGNVGPTAEKAGLTFEELFSALATGTKVGLRTSTVVDSLRTALAATFRPSEQATELAEELGLQFDTGVAAFQVGKVHPVFGTAWDAAAGFYASSLAEDYELAEQIGVLAEVDLGDAGVLAMGVFYADDTVLSESAGFNRGRNSSAAGGAGNTGKLNNVALQWGKEWDATFDYAGVRFLSASTGDVSDETGFVAGLGHAFDGGLDVFAEVAAFDGYGGTTDNATYATLNAAYAIGNLTLSGTYGYRDVDSAGSTDLISIGADFELANGMTIGGAVAKVDDAGTEDTLLGVNLVIPLGG